MAQPVFTQWDFLDPLSMAAKLEAAHGAPVFDNQSLLDPARMEAQINALSSTPPFTNYVGINDSRWTPGAATAPDVDWSLADAIGDI
jgi:hypothetical protein